MEYAAPVWDLYYNTDIYKLEKYKEELLDGFYLNTLELPMLHHCYLLLIYLHYNITVNYQD